MSLQEISASKHSRDVKTRVCSGLQRFGVNCLVFPLRRPDSSLLPLSWGVEHFQPSACAGVVDLEVPLEWGKGWDLGVVELEAGLCWASTSAEQRCSRWWVWKCFGTPALPFLWEPACFELAAPGRSAWCFLRRTVSHSAPPSYSGCALEAVLKWGENIVLCWSCA